MKPLAGAGWWHDHGGVLSDGIANHLLVSGNGTKCVPESWTSTRVRQVRHFLGCKMYRRAQISSNQDKQYFYTVFLKIKIMQK